MAKQVAKVENGSARPSRVSLLEKLGVRFGVEPDKLMASLKATAFHTGKEVTNEQMLALLVVADTYHLNPFLRELYAFPDTNKGGIVPVVSIDGWVSIINARPELSYIEFAFSEDDAPDPWVSCTIGRKDREKAVTIREYLSECARPTGPWKSHPRRMLRHKAFIQAARIAFGFAGFYDPDEAERIANATAIDTTASEVRRGQIGRVEPLKPGGYDDWLDNFRAVADEGESELANSFANSPPEFRAYLTGHDTAVWDALKVKATAASRADA